LQGGSWKISDGSVLQIGSAAAEKARNATIKARTILMIGKAIKLST
jgi:hypothetical protein